MKEQEIYQTMSNMPSRNIELVEQKTKEQKRLEKQFQLRQTYDRISLPQV